MIATNEYISTESAKSKQAVKRRRKHTPSNLPPGLILRGRTYHADFMKNGRRIRQSLETGDFEVACDVMNELRSKVVKGKWNLLDNRYPWEQLKKDFIAWTKQHIRRWKEYQSDLEKFEEFCHVRCVSLVTPRLIDKFREQRLAEGITPRTINRQIGTIRNMLGKGVHRFKVLASNPLIDIKRLPEGDSTKCRRSLTAEEIAAIFKHSRPEMVPVWRLYATTGMRKMELVTLRLADIDWHDRSLTIRASIAKGKKPRRILLDDSMLAMLSELHRDSTNRPEGWDREHVFINHEGRQHKNNLLRKFYGTCKRAGIVDGKRNGSVDLHSLRVTFTTLSLEGGASPKAVQSILGHATLDMTMRVYAKATDRSMRDAINALPFATATSAGSLAGKGIAGFSSQDSTTKFAKKNSRLRLVATLSSITTYN